MNSVVIVGRMARDPNVKESQNGNRFVRFSVAVDRPAAPGEPKQADFPQCIAFGKTAELIFLAINSLRISASSQTACL